LIIKTFTEFNTLEMLARLNSVWTVLVKRISSSRNYLLKKTMQNKKIKIEIWSDIVCPFCFIGKKKMDLAIAKLKLEDQVDLTWRSFQLDPDFPLNTSISTNEYLVQRKGYPQEQVNQMTSQLKEQGKTYNIDFQFEKARSFNTLDAHKLIKYAKKEGKSNELKESLMLNYFTNGIDLSKKENLLHIINQMGLDIEKAKQVIETKAYQEEIENDIIKAKHLGIRGVPYFLINEKLTISGAQQDNVFENVLVTTLKNLTSVENNIQGEVCSPDGDCC